MRDPWLHQETVPDAAVDAPVDLPPVVDDGEPAPAVAPAPQFDLDDPRVVDFLEGRVAEMTEARLQALAARAPAPAPAPGAPVDYNEVLSPLSDNFGQSLVQLLSERDQWLLTQFEQRLEPVLTREQETQLTQGHQMMDAVISEHWNEAADGKLTANVANAIKDIAPTYLAEMQGRYGETPRAAQQALAKAASTVRALTTENRAAGTQANIDELAAVAGAAGEPGTGGGAMNVPPPDKSPRDVMARYFGPNGGLGRS